MSRAESTSAAETGQPQGTGARPGYAWYAVSLLLCANILNFVDRKLPFILIESIKRDLSMTDTQVGLVGGVLFMATYSIAGLVLARLADRYSRKVVLVSSIIGWSMFTAAGGLARNFGHFALARMGVAVAESGAAPAAQSMISDLFPAHRRALPMAVFAAGSSIGFMGGLMIGGVINDVASWRHALIVVLVPGLIVALLIAFTVREPKPGASEVHQVSAAPAPKLRQAFAEFARKPALAYVLAGATFLTIAANGVTAFTAAFFIRSHDLSTSQTGLMLGLALGIGGGFGSLLGGYLSDRTGRTNPRMRLWAPGAMTLLFPPLLTAALLLPSANAAIVVMTFSFVCSACFVAPVMAVVHSLVQPRMRSTASAITFLFTQGIGASVGPVAVGMISDGLAPTTGEDSLRFALICVGWTALIGSIFYFIAGAALRKDLARTEAEAAAQAG